jgi:hypothetical protein
VELIKKVLENKNIIDNELETMRGLLCYDKNGKPKYGAAYLIRFWFDKVEKDSSQLFYGSSDAYKRFYKGICLLNPRRKSNKELIRDEFTEKEIASKLEYARKKNQQQLKQMVRDTYNISDNDTIEAKCETLLHALSDVSVNEQFIRRCRVQDIVLFLTVREMLVSMLSTNADVKANDTHRNQTANRVSELQLSDFGFDNDFDFLSSDNESALSYTYKYGGIEIVMPGMSLKNYGTIYRVLGDDRIKYLMQGLEKLDVKKVTFAELTGELARHDQQRTLFMKLAHEIEQRSFDRNRKDLNDDTNPKFYTEWSKYNPSNPTKMVESTFAKRNHFIELVELLEEYKEVIYVTLKKEKKESVSLGQYLNELRNSAAHNRYPGKDVFENVFKNLIGRIEEDKMPDLIQKIEQDAEDRITEANNDGAKK